MTSYTKDIHTCGDIIIGEYGCDNMLIVNGSIEACVINTNSIIPLNGNNINIGSPNYCDTDIYLNGDVHICGTLEFDGNLNLSNLEFTDLIVKDNLTVGNLDCISNIFLGGDVVICGNLDIGGNLFVNQGNIINLYTSNIYPSNSSNIIEIGNSSSCDLNVVINGNLELCGNITAFGINTNVGTITNLTSNLITSNNIISTNLTSNQGNIQTLYTSNIYPSNSSNIINFGNPLTCDLDVIINGNLQLCGNITANSLYVDNIFGPSFDNLAKLTKTLMEAHGSLSKNTTGGKNLSIPFILNVGATDCVQSNISTSTIPKMTYIDGANFPPISSLSPQLNIIINCFTNNGTQSPNPTTFTFGLYRILSISGTTNGELSVNTSPTPELGTTITFSWTSLGMMFYGVSSTFTIPPTGFYCIGVIISNQLLQQTGIAINAYLQLSYA